MCDYKTRNGLDNVVNVKTNYVYNVSKLIITIIVSHVLIVDIRLLIIVMKIIYVDLMFCHQIHYYTQDSVYEDELDNITAVSG